MEENLNIANFFQLNTAKEITYFVEYDPITGSIIKVGPDHAFNDVHYKLEIDKDTALGMIQGKIVVSSYHVDTLKNQCILSQNKNVIKIDDILHRITEDKWASYDYPDIFLTYYKNNNSIKLEMSEKFYGTKKIPKKFHPFSKRRIHWDGDTSMTFHVTEYNDPTIVYEFFTISLNDLFEKSHTVILKNEVNEDFSIFTRRIFENYGLIKK